MPEIKWIKLSTTLFDDEKIKLIERMPDSDTILVIWFKLLSLAGKTNDDGKIYLSQNISYTDEMLATVFSRPISTVRLALKTFQDFGMISIDDDNLIEVINWEKHQNVDGMKKIREQTRKRVARHREKKRVEETGKTLQKPEKEENKPYDDKDIEGSNVNVTLPNATELELELDKSREDKTLKNVKEKSTRSKYNFEQSHLQLAELLFKQIQKNNPNHKKPNLESWANTFRLMMERDGRTGKEIQDVILWTQQDDFWYKNVLSANKLREQYDRLVLQMKDDNKGGKTNGETSFKTDYTKYDFSKRGNVSWLPDES